MILADFLLIFRWWVVIFTISLVFLPSTILIFKNFFDKGYTFSKIIGVFFLSYLIWILGSLKLLSFNQLNILLVAGILAVINLFLIKKFELFQLKLPWKLFLIEELLFTAGLVTWSYIKSFEPSIHGLEKFMDYGFINSILRSGYFPPTDLWMSQKTINYYYFGHLVTAVLTKISNISPNFTFNLMISTLCGLTLASSFSIGANLFSFFSKKIRLVLIAGFLSAFLVTFSGNLHSIYAFFSNYPPENPIPFWSLKPDINPSYWYANATRFIPFTIHEFPLYSFVVSDLHGHVLNIPVVLFIIALLIHIFHQVQIKFFSLILLGLSIALAIMTNFLDGPIYLLLTSIVLFFKKTPKLLIKLLVIAASTLVFSLPFWLNFKPFSSGIGVLCAPTFLTGIGQLGIFLFEENHCQRSVFWMLMIIYGFFLLPLVGYLLLLRPSLKKPLLTDSDKLILILTLFSFIAILIPELIYVKDIYPAHFRANTVFKFGYQAFIILSLVSSFMIIRIISAKNYSLIKITHFIILAVGLFLISIYPYFAINSYFNSLKNYKGLDGLSYLKDIYRGDYTAIGWLNQNIKGQTILLEAHGESYSDYARISANTGISTVIGWPVHEWLWRNSVDEINIRKGDVDKIYESLDLELTKKLISKYHISYIYIGELERQKYPNLNEDKFKKFGSEIYRNNQTIIYIIN